MPIYNQKSYKMIKQIQLPICGPNPSFWKAMLISSMMSVVAVATAQKAVTGTVVDAESGEELIGATVMETGTTNGIITDFDGKFSLSISGDSLTVTYIGFEAKTVGVGARTDLTIELEPDLEQLEEVVVIGYGEQSKKVATASISKVSGKEIEGFGVPNVANTLQGQVSGVVFKSPSGRPGAGIDIVIRGPGTSGNSSPLVIIDGMLFDGTGILNTINPSDIESVNVLKDGASTAIYGTRGANGVIIVTTKKGTEIGTIDYSFSKGVQHAWKVPEVLNAQQYKELLTEKYENSGVAPPEALTNPVCATCDTDWVGDLFETGTVENHNFSYGRSSKNGSFRGSFSRFKNEGIIAPEKSNYERSTVRLNGEQKVNSYAKFGTNLTYINTKFQTIEENNSFGGPIPAALVYDPLTPVYDKNGQFGFAQSLLVRKEYINPLSSIYLDNDKNQGHEIYGNAFLELDLIKHFTFKSDFAVQKAFIGWEGWTPSYEPLHADNGGNLLNDVWIGSSEFERWKWENTIRYKRQFNKHKVEALAGYSAQRDNGRGLSASGQNLPEDRFTENWRFVGEAPDSLERANNWVNTTYSVVSAFGRAIYSYDDKYLLTVIMRRDGTSRFGAKKRHGIFPSFSLGWVVTSEDFWSLQQVSFLKLRASYGENGNDRIPENQFRSLITGGPNYQFGKGDNQEVYFGLTTPNAANPFLHWETSKHLDIGIEGGLFNDMVSFEVDYFRKVTSGLLLAGKPPTYLGTGPAIENVSEFLNSGIELTLGYSKQIGDVDFNSNLNVSTLKNEVTKLDGEDNSFFNGFTWPVRNVAISRMEEGQPVGYFRGYKTDGIFRSEAEVFQHIGPDGNPLQPDASPGDLKFIDQNGDGKLTDDDMGYIGKPWADLTVGLQLNASWKGFALSTVWFASVGSELYRVYERQDVTNNNYQTTWLDRYHETKNPNGAYPRLVSNDVNRNSRPSDFYVESGDFLRLKNVQLSYTVPSQIVGKAKIKNLRIFVSVDNLLTVTGYTGYDPEIGGGILSSGIDQGFYPLPRTITGGFSIQL